MSHPMTLGKHNACGPAQSFMLPSLS